VPAAIHGRPAEVAGEPDQQVSSFTCNRSWPVPAKHIAPRRPLPRDNASVQSEAGRE